MLVLPHIPSRNKKQWDSPPMFIPLLLQRKQYSYQRPTSPHVVCKVCITASPTFSRKSCSILMSKRCLKFNSLFPSLSSIKSYSPPNLCQHFQWHPYLCNCSRWKSGSILDFPSLTTLIKLYPFPLISSVQFSSFAQPCPTLCNPINRSTPGLPVHYQLPEFTQTHVHRVSDAIQPSHPLLSPSPLAPNTSQHQGLFQWVNSSHEVAKVLEFQLQHQSFQWTPRTGLL